jgi:GLPGLI family protein
MKRILLAGSALLATGLAHAQQKEGRVLYERTVQMQMRFQGMGDEVERMIPRSRTDKFEVLFANNQSLRRAIQDERPEEESPAGGGGIQIRVMGSGVDDISYSNFSEGRITEQREFATKTYIVADSIRKLNWKLTGENKTVLGFPCMKATAQRISQRTMMSMDNGQMKRQLVDDTANITVWFTGSVPVSAGPDFQGQLPGLILEIDINNGRTVYKALEVSPKVDVAAIKEPKSGKKVTQDEFNKERDKAMEEMQRNNGGRGRTIIRAGG